MRRERNKAKNNNENITRESTAGRPSATVADLPAPAEGEASETMIIASATEAEAEAAKIVSTHKLRYRTPTAGVHVLVMMHFRNQIFI